MRRRVSQQPISKYGALVYVTVHMTNGFEIEWTRRCELPVYFSAVPGNYIPLCRSRSGWWLAKIEDAAQTPEYIKGSLSNLEIFTQVRVMMGEDHHVPDLCKRLERLGWKKEKDDRTEE